jgi:hypothetical protein|tara:strand:- start:1391 stop:1996 length:606 start_codon:yes stop_codon:yes gene_type:complete
MKEFIQEIPVLNTSELRKINKYINTLNFEPNTVFDANGTAREDPRIRSSTGTSMDENNPATKLLHEKLNNALLKYKNRLFNYDLVLNSYPVIGADATSSYREEIQVLQYSEDQKYNWHFDACTDPKSPFYHRQTSIVLYLKDNFEGGATKFKMLPHHEYKPKAGSGLFFPSNWCFTHCSTPLESGIKRVAVTWYYCIDELA